MKKIQFIPESEFVENCLTPPIPANKMDNEWQKKNSFPIENLNNSIITGYVVCLSNDLEIINLGDGKIDFYWRTSYTTITAHAKDQHPYLPYPFGGCNDHVFKFSNGYIIKTPKGYSTYFTHPINQHDLPFRTLSGVVDTDTFMKTIHFPFQFISTNKEITVLEKGTPICQFIPFKRDSWKHEIFKYNDTFRTKQQSKLCQLYKSLYPIKDKFN